MQMTPALKIRIVTFTLFFHFATFLYSQDFTLTLGTFDSCTLDLPVQWSAYTGWTEGVDRYEIWSTEKSPASDWPGPPMMVGEVDGATTSFVYFADDGRQHCIQIAAIATAEADTVLSNQICFDLPNIPYARDMVLYKVTTEKGIDETPAGKIVLQWNAEPQPYFHTSVLRRSRNGVDFEQVPGFDANGFYFEDLNAGAHLGPLTYQIIAADGCGNEAVSNLVTTVFLQGDVNEQGENILHWTPYHNDYVFDGLYYRVDTNQAFLNDGFLPKQMTYPADVFTHIDQVDRNDPAQRGRCYLIEAEARLYKSGIFYPVRSRSNWVCPQGPAPIFMPNAFVPGGLNPEFKPVTLLTEARDYAMLIYDRFGGLLFESRDISHGWDGKKNGRPLPQGVYLYLVRLKRENDQVVEQKGVVMLLR